MQFYLFLFLLSSLWLWAAIAVYLVTAPTRYGEDEEGDEGNAKANARAKKASGNSCTIVVLGDIGRSPRMQYHAISMSKHGMKVELVGFQESDLHPKLVNNPSVTLHALRPVPRILAWRSMLVLPVVLPLKALHQALALYWTVAVKVPATRFILIQNPPSIPTIAITLFTAALRNSKLIIDWHNLGYSVLALRLGQNHALVRMAKAYELTLAKYASGHFAVSSAMAGFLRDNAGLADAKEPVVLHDRPAPSFKPLRSHNERANFLRNLPETKEYAEDILKGRWRLVVSSTSWSDDEDFSLLLDALVAYSGKSNVSDFLGNSANMPKILFIITGKGPKRLHYLDQIVALNQDNRLSQAIIRTAWLSQDDYAKLLASADLGVSLHQSTSGVDLPMKVVDMFGAGLPVAGYSKFAAWPELVQEGKNGMGFETSQQLEAILLKLLASDDSPLQQLKAGAMLEGKKRWDDEWDRVAKSVFELA